MIKNKKTVKIVSVVLLVLTAVLAVVSYAVLPETVTTQLSIGSSGATVMPKLAAVLVPTALGAGGALFSLFAADDEKSRGKGLLLSVVGVLVFCVMLAVNLI